MKKDQESAVKKAQEAAAASKLAAAESKLAAAEAQWSVDQQKQLEIGMKDFPSTIAAKERWTSIATKVDGKGPKQCFERFKDLCAKAKAK